MGYLTKLLRLALLHSVSFLTCNADLIQNQTVNGGRGEDSVRQGNDDNTAAEHQETQGNNNNNNTTEPSSSSRSIFHELAAKALHVDNPNQLHRPIVLLLYTSAVFDVIDILNVILDLVVIVRLYQFNGENLKVYAIVMLTGLLLGRIVSWRGTTLLFRYGIRWHPFWIRPQWPLLRHSEKKDESQGQVQQQQQQQQLQQQQLPSPSAQQEADNDDDETGNGRDNEQEEHDTMANSNNHNDDDDMTSSFTAAASLLDDKNQRALYILYCLVFTEASVFFLEDYPSLVVYDQWMVLAFPPAELEYLDNVNVAMSAVALSVLCLFFLVSILLSLYLLLHYDWHNAWNSGLLKTFNTTKIALFLTACALLLWAITDVLQGAIKVVFQQERHMPRNTILGDWIELCPSTSFDERDELCDERIFLVRVAWAWLVAAVFAVYLIWFPAHAATTTTTTTPGGVPSEGQQ